MERKEKFQGFQAIKIPRLDIKTFKCSCGNTYKVVFFDPGHCDPCLKEVK